jgi:hypothetical protein
VGESPQKHQESRERGEQRQPCHRAAADRARPRREEPRILGEHRRRRRRRRRHPGERPRGGPGRPHRAEGERRRGPRRQERRDAAVVRGAGGRTEPHGRDQQDCWPQGRRHPRFARRSFLASDDEVVRVCSVDEEDVFNPACQLAKNIVWRPGCRPGVAAGRLMPIGGPSVALMRHCRAATVQSCCS